MLTVLAYVRNEPEWLRISLDSELQGWKESYYSNKPRVSTGKVKFRDLQTIHFFSIFFLTFMLSMKIQTHNSL